MSASAVGSPKLLLLSGVGDKEDLSELNIKTKKHLPDVGKNLQDHLFVPITFKSINNKNIDALTIEFEKKKINLAKEILKYMIYGRGVLSTSGLDSTLFSKNNKIDKCPSIQIMSTNFNAPLDIIKNNLNISE